MELEEFAPLFRLVLSQYDVGTIPVSLDRVTAGETTRQTGHRVKALFFLGADDASLPQVGTTPGLLSDDDRSLLAAYGLELDQTQRDLLYREMTTIYQICARPSQKLVVSRPGQGAGGEERRPSFLIGRIRLIFENLPISREDRLKGAFRLEAPSRPWSRRGGTGRPAGPWRSFRTSGKRWPGWTGPRPGSGAACPGRRWTGSTASRWPCPPPGWTNINPVISPISCGTA